MESHKEVMIFSTGAPIQLPADLPPLPMNVYSEFGFKLITVKEKDCEDVQVWTVATEKDYQTLLAKLRNISVEDVEMIQPDPENNPPQFQRCHLFNGVCTGRCASLQFCRGVYDIKLGLVGCACI